MLVVGVLAAIFLVLRHTVWSGKIAEKELAAKEHKLVLQEQAALVEDELAVEELEDLSVEDELDLSEDIEVFEGEVAEIVNEGELFEEGDLTLVEDETWVADSLVEEPEEWLDDHLPDVDTEELPEIDEEYAANEPDDDNPDEA
jgi:hypothetical protein